MLNIGIEEVKSYLEDVKKLVKGKHYLVSKRSKNADFIEKYGISYLLIEDIILSLTYKDFSYADYNEHPEFKDEILYVFGKQVKVTTRLMDAENFINLYIKLNKTDDNLLIIVSIHEQEYPLVLKFK